ncbi:HypC/HybG/HupF family hydrogenase formation chaperone [Dehalogenimonas etheniformans]|uniref:HypC/HybG/HupF family hydrogenase formation chaperone n=1 Tax=Dehalogenimonas etheniformans TaxID=1536648 RepID=A0A2P5P6Q0_9CHLR|nr:HypC/HybG/HupF family hydrogenase formation chaperone [Dehalogenimonas etheniformans]PPD57973.1 HypC/HybG/HupF family hydrogenase formation chaperone [Dehalogenimonas etheniformans]QNT75324.1 HypC/HybG/HupF family hydrogenase formation chaperone [Dehalogenimonas etheniformans]
MCLAVPAKIVRIDDTIAEVDMAGTTVRASLVMVPDAKLGDYVLLHTGFAIQVLDEHEALETLELFKEMEMIPETT